MKTLLLRVTTASLLAATVGGAQDARLERLKTEAVAKIEQRAKLIQEIIDQTGH